MQMKAVWTCVYTYEKLPLWCEWLKLLNGILNPHCISLKECMRILILIWGITNGTQARMKGAKLRNEVWILQISNNCNFSGMIRKQK